MLGSRQHGSSITIGTYSNEYQHNKPAVNFESDEFEEDNGSNDGEPRVDNTINISDGNSQWIPKIKFRKQPHKL